MNAPCGSLRSPRLQGLNLPFRISLPSCKSPMFQPAGAGLSLDLNWRQSIPFLGSPPACPRLPARLGAQARGHAAVKPASQEQHLLRFTAVTSGEGYLGGRCGELPLHPYRPPQMALPPPFEPASPHWGRSTRPIFLPTTVLRVLPLPRPPFHAPRSTPTAYRELSLPAPPHPRGQSFPPTTQSRESAPRGRGSFRISQAPPTPTTCAQ